MKQPNNTSTVWFIFAWGAQKLSAGFDGSLVIITT